MNDRTRSRHFPGRELSDYVKWNLNIIITDLMHTDPTLYNKQIAACIGEPLLLNQKQFDIVIKLFEPYKEEVEECLNRFDTLADEWLSFAEYQIVFIPSSIYVSVETLLLTNFHGYIHE